jgi:hypothetical protein
VAKHDDFKLLEPLGAGPQQGELDELAHGEVDEPGGHDGPPDARMGPGRATLRAANRKPASHTCRDASAAATIGFAHPTGPTSNGTVDTLEEDSQAKRVTNFQRPEDGAWDPRHPNDFYFVTTSAFGPLPAENRTGETRLWRMRFANPTDPSRGGKLTLLVSGAVGTADSPSATGTQSAGSPGPQMFDNVTVNTRGQVIMLEDVGNQAYLGDVWVYDIASGKLTKIAQHDPDRFAPGPPVS